MPCPVAAITDASSVESKISPSGPIERNGVGGLGIVISRTGVGNGGSSSVSLGINLHFHPSGMGAKTANQTPFVQRPGLSPRPCQHLQTFKTGPNKKLNPKRWQIHSKIMWVATCALRSPRTRGEGPIVVVRHRPFTDHTRLQRPGANFEYWIDGTPAFAPTSAQQLLATSPNVHPLAELTV